MSEENWRLQVSYKTPNGDMVNVRANTTDELSVLLEGVGDYSTQIAATQQLITASYNAAPLSTQSSTAGTTQIITSAPTQVAVPSAGPTCIHGPRKFMSGTSKKTGNPYSMWVCPLPQGPNQCSPVN